MSVNMHSEFVTVISEKKERIKSAFCHTFVLGNTNI